MKRLTLPLVAGLLVACSAFDAARTGTAQSAPDAAASVPGEAEPSAPEASQRKSDSKLIEAATTPLGDLNLVRAEIPAALRAAQKAPYAVPADASCSALAADIQALDALLGADLDTPVTAANPSLIERGASAAGNAAVGAVRNTAEGVVPFRRWVRKLTGAERYAKDVAAAIAAGTIRRAYLKGLGQAAGCQAPASPRK